MKLAQEVLKLGALAINVLAHREYNQALSHRDA